MAGSFTITASRNAGNRCEPDFIIGQPFTLTFAGDSGEPGFGADFVIRWTINSDNGCGPESQVNNGTQVEAGTQPMTTGLVGELFYQGTIFDRHGNPTFTSACLPLCFVEDKIIPTITITASPSEVMQHECSDVRAHVEGAAPTGGGVSGQWGPGNPRKNCDDPIGSPATDFGITADVTVDDWEAPIAGCFDTCGVWGFSFNYGGDACNYPVNSGCKDVVTVFCTLPAVPVVTTTTEPDDGYVGDTFFDTAELSGAYRPTGSMTFILYGDTKCLSPVYAETIPVSGNGSYETPHGYVAMTPGTFYWRAFYSGDSNNDGVASACNEEPIVIHRKDVSISTTPSGGAAVGDDVDDTADIATLNTHALTGALTFNLVGPDNCDDLVTSEVVPIAGDGSYVNTPVAVLMPGTYHWTIHYPGDANHAPYTTDCALETFTVTDEGAVYSPTIVTNASPTSSEVGLGGADIAKLSGGNFPTGTLTFRLYGPGDPTCSSPAVYTTTVAVDHDNGLYPCPPKPSFALAGDYYWTVEYSGDLQNNPIAETSCGDPDEKVTVTTFVPKPMYSRFRHTDAVQMFAKPIQ